MATAKKPRKKYNPNKTQFTTNPMLRYDKQAGDSLKFRIYFHLLAFTERRAVGGDWVALQFRMKVGLGLAPLFNQTETIEIFTQALALLDLVKERRHRIGIWAMGDPEIDQIKTALELVDQIQDKTTRVEQMPVFMKANKEVDSTMFDVA